MRCGDGASLFLIVLLFVRSLRGGAADDAAAAERAASAGAAGVGAFSISVADVGGGGRFGGEPDQQRPRDIVRRPAFAWEELLHKGRRGARSVVRSISNSSETEADAEALEAEEDLDDDVSPVHWTLRGLMSWLLWILMGVLVVRFVYQRKVARKGKEKDSDASPQRTFKHGHFQCFDDTAIFFWAVACPAVRWADTLDLGGLQAFWKAFALYAGLAVLNYGVVYNGVAFAVLTVISVVAYAIVGRLSEKLFPTAGESGEAAAAPAASVNWRAMMIIVVIAGACGIVWLAVGDAIQALLSAYMSLYGCFTFGIFTSAAMLHYRQRLRERLGLQHGDGETLAEDCCFLFWCPCCAISQEARVVEEAHEAGLGHVADGPLTKQLFAPQQEELAKHFFATPAETQATVEQRASPYGSV